MNYSTRTEITNKNIDISIAKNNIIRVSETYKSTLTTKVTLTATNPHPKLNNSYIKWRKGDKLPDASLDSITAKIWACNHQVTLHPGKQSTNPDDSIRTTKVSNFKKSPWYDLIEISSIYDVAELVANGQTVVPCEFPQTRRKDKFKATRLIFLDQDKGCPQETLDSLNKLGLEPALIYETMTSSYEQRKHRFVLWLDELITDYKEFQAILKNIVVSVPNLDVQCTDPTRIYYPAKTDSTLLVAPSKITRCDVLRAVVVGSLDEVGESGNSCIYNTDFPSNFQLSENNTKFKYLDNGMYLTEIQTNPLVVTANNLWGRFLLSESEGQTHHSIGYKELRKIWTNLRFFKGGKKLFKRIVNSYSDEYQYKQNALLLTEAKFDRYPMKIDGLGCTLHTVAKGNAVIPVPEGKAPRVPLDVAEAEFYDALEASLCTLDGKFNVVNAYTGIGKTRAIMALAEEQPLIIAVKTLSHIDDAMKHTKDNTNVLAQFTFKHEDVPADIQHAWDCKKFDRANMLIDNYSKDEGHPYFEFCAELKHNKQELLQHEGSIVVTHSFVKNYFNKLDIDRYHIVFDENPVNAMCEMTTIPHADIVKMASYSSNWQHVLDVWEHSSHNTFVPLSMIPLVEDTVIDRMEKDGFKFPVGSFDFTDNITVQILKNNTKGLTFFFGRQSFLDATIIVLDATPQKTLLKGLIPEERLIFHNIPTPEISGNIRQIHHQSFSRRKMKEEFKVLLEILESANIKHTHTILTFKSQIQPLRDAGFTVDDDCYFGNEFGFDHLKGKNLAIVGTPNLSPEAYLAQAFACGYDVGNIESTNMTTVSVENNGFTYKLFTFVDKILQKLHIEFVNGSLMQAVGRARSLREDVDVVVFSNFMLDLA